MDSLGKEQLFLAFSRKAGEDTVSNVRIRTTANDQVTQGVRDIHWGHQGVIEGSSRREIHAVMKIGNRRDVSPHNSLVLNRLSTSR